MRLFTYSCKAKDMGKFLATIQFLLQEYNRTSPVTMNIDTGGRCNRKKFKSTTKNASNGAM